MFEVNVKMASVIHKTELSSLLAERLGISQSLRRRCHFRCSTLVSSSENDRLTLTGFGTFSVRDRAARQMRAISGDKTGQMIDVPARKYVAFKAGNTLEQTVRDGH